ncbi:MAG TPA: hypothetical protein VE783_07120 [Candidatus Limnocylindrales bacterium]|nr:hypothetical protein [Candidatus Limnocylindrales bacterium]
MSPRKAAIKLILFCFLVVAGCKTPPHTAEGGPPAAANMPPPLSSPSPPTTAGSATSPPQEKTQKLSAVVQQIFAAANVTGSLTERCRCAREHLLETYSLPENFPAEPMETALKELEKHYPGFHDSHDRKGRVRLTDSTARGGLLRVRVKEFNVVEDHPPQAALAALWRVPEVETYLRAHAMRPGRGAQNVAVQKTAPLVIQMKNVTVADILDRIVETHHGDSAAGRFTLWVYRECHSGAETIIDFKLL